MIDKKFIDKKTGKYYKIFYHYDRVIKALPIDGSRGEIQFSQSFFESLLKDRQIIILK
jgi:hypothetical protein